MSKTLEQTREDARAEVERLDRLIEIKEFLTQKLTDESGAVINAHLEFELEDLKISIKKARVRNTRTEEPTKKAKAKKGSKRVKEEPKQLKPADVKKIKDLSFSQLKKREVVQLVQGVVPSFGNAYWNSFRENLGDALVGEGQGAGRQWTFNA